MSLELVIIGSEYNEKGNLKMKNFTAIDFETANYERTSACSIGVVVVKNGEIVSEKVSLIKPVPGYIIRKFTAIHGLTIEDVKDAPDFDKVWSEIADDIINAETLVAHNSVFDKSVMESCLGYYSIKAELPQFYCTYRESKRKLPFLRSHSLSSVCEHFDIPLNHHEALSDARGAAKIALLLSQ